MFNFVQSNNANISNNNSFQFAQKHALHFYKYNIIYSFIPKNGCTTLRASVAATNGLIEQNKLHNENINWIHNNTYTFGATLQELINCRYKFTVLRCPYDRLISLFLDKFVEKTPVAWNFYKQSNNRYNLNYLTFSEFVNYLYNHPGIMQGDIHWRKQNDYLIFKKYDQYFDFANYSEIKETLSRNFPIQFVDTRQITKHGRGKLTKTTEKHFSDVSCNELLNLKLSGYIPSNESMLSSTIKNKIQSIYKQDFALLDKHHIPYTE